MRFTIERIRTLVLVAAALLLIALGVFLVRAKLKNVLNRHDLPQKLAKGIVQEANGYTIVHAFGAHSQYRIHASREVELKNDFVELHDVEIDLYGADGSEIDKISGDTFEYNQTSGQATAQGPVEMLLTRPSPSTAAAMETAGKTKGRVIAEVGAAPGPAGQIDVKTSGVTFDRKSGLVTTSERVDFSTAQGSGSAIGASYDSQNGYLTLEQQVEMTTHRGADELQVHAQRGELDRGAQSCMLMNANAEFHGGKATAAEARILFRQDGSAQRLDAKGGFAVTAANGGHLASPVAWMDFDQHSEPLHGHMEGGVTMDSSTAERTLHATSPAAELDFGAKGELKTAHLQRGVEMKSQEARPESAGQDAGSGQLQVTRTWRSPVVDIGFRAGRGTGREHSASASSAQGQLEVATMRGSGGVTITSESQRGNQPVAPSTLSADEVTGIFGAGSVLRAVTGIGHAKIDETTATGALESATGDRLQADFDEGSEHGTERPRSRESREQGSKAARTRGSTTETSVQSAELDGNVVLFEQPAQRPGSQSQPALRATAGKAVYEGAGEWLHLTVNPRVTNGNLDMTADRVDVSRQSGEAWARGDVKATWSNVGSDERSDTSIASSGSGAVTLGGKGPAHVVAEEARLNQSTGEATFRGHARLWQETNFVSGPLIVLNQHLQTLAARSSDPAEPVRVVMLSAENGLAKTGNHESGANSGNSPGSGSASSAASVIRVSGGDLRYSDVERRAVMRGGALGAVVAETGTATSSSDVVELLLVPAGSRDANRGAQPRTGGMQAQVDRMKAVGHVALTMQGRRGTGEQLVYTGATGEYVLTGTAAAPPKLTDPGRGTVTGEALIFDSRDDRVSIEGGGRETETDTTAPEPRQK
ncbi:MAG TPA: LptA/OstA family protein [Terracidiphilus sp.]|nr:LptA/OstA family protein [Terracidiphilus sp.]